MLLPSIRLVARRASSLAARRAVPAVSAVSAASRPQVVALAMPSRSRPATTWATVPQGPPDAILGVSEAFKADPNPQKINLGVGAYRDDEGKPYVLPSVRAAEGKVIASRMNKEYAGITGLPELTAAATKLAYGASSPALANLAVTQSISGTGALRVGGAFLARFYPTASGRNIKTIYIPTPSWANHVSVFADCGLEVKKYAYYDKQKIGLDLAGLLHDVGAAPEGSMFLFHACAHNPTGVDPTREQWIEIEKAVRQKGHFVFFDMAYQGFASGDVDADAFAARYFVEKGHRIFLAQSFAKNMGLYGERVGAFSMVTSSAEEKKRVESQIKIIVRAMYSNPPIHGARIAAEILNTPALYSQWLSEVKGMADRIIRMRALLRENLVQLGSRRDWSHITSQIGMFAFTGLTPEQMDALRDNHSVYATRDGRISVAGITSGNVQRLAEAIFQVAG